MRPVSDEPIAPEPARLQRGSYLVNNVLSCGACHTAREHGNMLTEPERTDAFWAGATSTTTRAMRRRSGSPTSRPTSRPASAAGKTTRSCARCATASPGRPLPGAADAVRRLPASVRRRRARGGRLPAHGAAYKQPKPRPDNKLGFMPKLLFRVIGVQMHKPVAGVPAPDRANKDEYGHYLVRVAACGDCHSLTEKGPRPETDPLAFAGSDVPFEDPGAGQGLREQHQRRPRDRPRPLRRRGDQAGVAQRHAPRRQEAWRRPCRS